MRKKIFTRVKILPYKSLIKGKRYAFTTGKSGDLTKLFNSIPNNARNRQKQNKTNTDVGSELTCLELSSGRALTL